MILEALTRCPKPLLGLAVLACALVNGAPSQADIPSSNFRAPFEVGRIALPDYSRSRTKLGPLRFRGGVLLTGRDGEFQGFSGLWVSPDGAHLAAVEGGDWIEGQLQYDQAGDLNGLKMTRGGPLLDAARKPFSEEADKDAEALDFDGRHFLVGFETHNRVLAYESLRGPAHPIDLLPEALANIPPATGFSSIVGLSPTSFFALPEYTPDGTPSKTYKPSKTRGWLVTPKGSGPMWLRESNGALPVSLALLPNGDFLLVELLVSPDNEITDTRLSCISSSALTIGATMDAQKLAVIAPPLPGSRVEGASARLGPKGETLIYLMSGQGPAALYMFELTDLRNSTRCKVVKR